MSFEQKPKMKSYIERSRQNRAVTKNNFLTEPSKLLKTAPSRKNRKRSIWMKKKRKTAEYVEEPPKKQYRSTFEDTNYFDDFGFNSFEKRVITSIKLFFRTFCIRTSIVRKLFYCVKLFLEK